MTELLKNVQMNIFLKVILEIDCYMILKHNSLKCNAMTTGFLGTSLVAALLLAVSCSDPLADIPLVELGTPVKEFILEPDGGIVELPVYSNGAYHIETLESVPWFALNAAGGSGDGTVKASLDINEGFRRMTRFVLCSDVDSRRDTISVKQKGMLAAELSIDNTSLIGPGAGGTYSAELRTNIDFADFVLDIQYPSLSEGWISSVNISGDDPKHKSLDIVTEANPEDNSVRNASISLLFIDGWGERTSLRINYIQKSSRELLGEVVSFSEARQFYSTGEPIDEYVLIEGIIVSDRDGGNAGDNEQKTTSTIDYSVSKKTAYLESTDGKYGFMILTDTEDDNVFNQYDRVQILLHGATITKREEPERYEITGVTKSMATSVVSGLASDVPVKRRSIGTLTDEDIYTYVTLDDVEFPVRKGSISPINEGYAIGGNVNRIAKFPLLVRGKDGNSMYMFTNTVCRYRNDGTRLPYGSGSISGVVVHERFSRFEWKDGADPLDIDIDPELGNIGRYQIRHQKKSDIWGHMNDSVEDSFSALLTEYRFWNPDSSEGVLRPTYGENGWLTHTYQSRYTGSEELDYTGDYGQHLLSEATYSYLGPMGISATGYFGLNVGNVNGLGIVLDPAHDRWSTEMEDWVGLFNGNSEWLAPVTSDEENKIRLANGGSTGSMRGKTWCSADCYCCFAAKNWWDFDAGRGYAWLMEFSTEGISTDCLSLQLSVQNTKIGTPRFWKVEWSETDSMAPADDAEWQKIAEYTVPDVSVYSNTLYSSLVGFKPIDIPLPLDMLGKKEVYLRLMPLSDVCSDGADYANAVMSEVSGLVPSSAIDYISIRYNK